MKGIQLTLFDDGKTSSQNEVSAKTLKDVNWSFSRRSTLEQCTRKYYYEYYGANKRSALLDPHKDQLNILKRMENRYTRTGSILHLVISQYFRQAQIGVLWDLNKLQRWAKDMFMKDLDYSIAHPTGNFLSDEKYPPVLLQEFNANIINAKDLCLEMLERTLDALNSFYSKEEFAFYREAGKKTGALVEHMFKLKIISCRIDGKIDLAFFDNGNVFILDWKSGRSDGGGDDSLQLVTYALWAVDNYECSPDKIRIMKAHLLEDLVVEFQVDARLLEIAKVRILQDAERMASLNHYGKEGIPDAFTPCAHKSVCRLCSYLSVCEEGKQSLYD